MSSARTSSTTDGLSSTLGGTLLPTNVGVRLPSEQHNWTLSSLHLVQRFGERSTLIAGKINTVDLLASEAVFGGTGDLRFMHLAFAAPPNGLTPPVIFGGILKFDTPALGWTFMAYDPNDRTDDTLDDLFGDGVNVSVGAKRGFELASRDSSLAVSAIYSTKGRANLVEELLPPGLRTGQKSNSWHVSLQFNHALRARDDAGRPASFSIKAGASDGNPNPFENWITAGIAGNGLFASRPRDGYGIGVFYYGFSSELQSAVAPLAKFPDEYGTEIFYDFALAPGFSVGLDLQYIRPATGANDKLLAAGLRVRLRF